METALRITDAVKSFRERRLSALRPPTEFFDYHRVSRPADVNQATSRISYNTRYFSGNYGVIVAILAVYALITNIYLLIAIVLFVGGFTLVNRFGTEPIQIAGNTITQKHLYTGLFIVGIPIFWLSSPFGTLFWLVGASSILILTHASLMEPGIESEYASVQDSV